MGLLTTFLGFVQALNNDNAYIGAVAIVGGVTAVASGTYARIVLSGFCQGNKKLYKFLICSILVHICLEVFSLNIYSYEHG